ncbi:unnamed protein product [Somion occarium]|uniref:Uncharacterized protein n=1 Tax=Somion occarium TaxID=3059160 RepID=A0ABP1DQC0_9APHY
MARSRDSIAGTRKAKVLPVPVLALTSKSRGPFLVSSSADSDSVVGGLTRSGSMGRTAACTGLMCVSFMGVVVMALRTS